jgi:hypothetical protein
LLTKWIFTDLQEMENYLFKRAKMTTDNDLHVDGIKSFL